MLYLSPSLNLTKREKKNSGINICQLHCFLVSPLVKSLPHETLTCAQTMKKVFQIMAALDIGSGRSLWYNS